MIRSKFIYKELTRNDGVGGRLYLCPDGSRVASVTTILDKTKSEEKRMALANWKKRVGEQAAQQIVTEAAGRGTSMHKLIERWLAGEDISEPGSNLVHQQASKMANLVINELIKPNVDEIWGSEVSLYFPGLYAGTTDCVGNWQGKAAILDFKQTNKPKKKEWIDDLRNKLSNVKTCWVKVAIPLSTLEEREVSRATSPKGHARSHYNTVHWNIAYDFEVNSEKDSAQTIAAHIKDFLKL